MLRSLLLVATLLAAGTASLGAQVEVPSLRWQTLETENFRIHYEPQLEAWARRVAERIESVRSAVADRVGYTYPHKIDLLVEDPLNVSNGSAWPSLTYPGMRFWATPPAPTSVIGNSRDWGELLAVHEYAHLAHLLRPSRKKFSLPLGIFSIVPFGPLPMAPAWVSEGYATVIEGELTGSGRPNGALRPAIIRSLALEGYLPAYGALDDAGRFNGGAMRYLIGSAYLEWLQAQHGDSVLPQLWQRATARRDLKFPAAFAATFGDSPDLLYGRFSAEVTRQAFEARAQIERNGLAQGTLVQKWTYAVGSPDISPNGERLAVRRTAPSDPGGIAVYTLEPDTAAQRRDSTALAKRLKRDSLDLPDVRPYPRPLRRVALLRPVAGASYDAPRWMPDGERILATRSVPMADGRSRFDLFEWRVKSGKVRRITKGAGILLADPLPNGTQAIAQTCGAGVCSLLRVDLASGATQMLAQGTLDASYHGARVSPDGRFAASARQRGAHWAPVVIDLANGNVRELGPSDGNSRYSPAWENDSTLLVVSDASGSPEIERLPLNGSAITVAVRTLGAASAPEVGPDGRIWWLDLHGRGYDLRVNDAATSVALGTPLDAALFPATRRVETSLAKQFTPQTLDAPRGYGAGPFGIAFLATAAGGADGDYWTAGATFGDPIGRGTGFAYAGIGRNGNWSGARAAYMWRGFRPALQLQGFHAEYLPSEHTRRVLPVLDALDREFTGGLLALAHTRYGARGALSVRLGGSIGTSVNPTLVDERRDRTLAFLEVGGSLRGSPAARRSLSAQWQATAAQGKSEDLDVTRYTADLRLAMEMPQGGVALRGRGGEVNRDAAGQEFFVVGGAASPYLDEILLTNRIEHLGLPFGITGGRRFGMLTVESTGPLRVYHDWIVAGDGEFGETLRLVGGEFTLELPRTSILRIPPTRLKAGVSHALNGPARNLTQAYTSLSVTP